ncbi:hypothetical protein VB264_21140 [Arcicella aquatica]|uniref:Uncharacterized protein n=1 Tax=Arcicella aquatica TaxID=217141 RepID=A0ABU5QTA1_9BACT|nr:hypothetical protein [Arcicella aquatica]MEA5260318.1 hypothetical protein [Arcicella aquatica]
MTTFTNTHSLLFDDLSTLESLLGKGVLKNKSLNANCDCAGYTSTDDDDEMDTSKSTETTSQEN